MKILIKWTVYPLIIVSIPRELCYFERSSRFLLGMIAMLRVIRQYFINSTKTIIRKSALMTEKEARRNTFLAVAAPLLAILFAYIGMTEVDHSIVMKWMVWWLVGIMVLGVILLPISLYGYYNRHQIDTSEEEPYNFSPGLTGALLGTALVPLARIVFDYFNI